MSHRAQILSVAAPATAASNTVTNVGKGVSTIPVTPGV
jgi:hypothetical protein